MGDYEFYQRQSSPGSGVADAAVAGYDKGKGKKQANQSLQKMKAGANKANLQTESAPSPMIDNVKLQSFKKGGKVKKTGPYRLHKGEEVLNVRAADKYRRGKTARKKISAKA